VWRIVSGQPLFVGKPSRNLAALTLVHYKIAMGPTQPDGALKLSD